MIACCTYHILGGPSWNRCSEETPETKARRDRERSKLNALAEASATTVSP